MIYQSKAMRKTIVVISAVCLSLLGLTSACIGGEGHKQKSAMESQGQHATDNLPADQRVIYGIVEAVNENTIKVNSGDTKEISPRYLELEKLENKANSAKPGDRLKIIVDIHNKVVDYQLANEKN